MGKASPSPSAPSGPKRIYKHRTSLAAAQSMKKGSLWISNGTAIIQGKKSGAAGGNGLYAAAEEGLIAWGDYFIEIEADSTAIPEEGGVYIFRDRSKIQKIKKIDFEGLYTNLFSQLKNAGPEVNENTDSIVRALVSILEPTGNPEDAIRFKTLLAQAEKANRLEIATEAFFKKPSGFLHVMKEPEDLERSPLIKNLSSNPKQAEALRKGVLKAAGSHLEWTQRTTEKLSKMLETGTAGEKQAILESIRGRKQLPIQFNKGLKALLKSSESNTFWRTVEAISSTDMSAELVGTINQEIIKMKVPPDSANFHFQLKQKLSPEAQAKYQRLIFESTLNNPTYENINRGLRADPEIKNYIFKYFEKENFHKGNLSFSEISIIRQNPDSDQAKLFKFAAADTDLQSKLLSGFKDLKTNWNLLGLLSEFEGDGFFSPNFSNLLFEGYKNSKSGSLKAQGFRLPEGLKNKLLGKSDIGAAMMWLDFGINDPKALAAIEKNISNILLGSEVYKDLSPSERFKLVSKIYGPDPGIKFFKNFLKAFDSYVESPALKDKKLGAIFSVLNELGLEFDEATKLAKTKILQNPPKPSLAKEFQKYLSRSPENNSYLRELADGRFKYFEKLRGTAFLEEVFTLDPNHQGAKDSLLKFLSGDVFAQSKAHEIIRDTQVQDPKFLGPLLDSLESTLSRSSPQGFYSSGLNLNTLMKAITTQDIDSSPRAKGLILESINKLSVYEDIFRNIIFNPKIEIEFREKVLNKIPIGQWGWAYETFRNPSPEISSQIAHPKNKGLIVKVFFQFQPYGYLNWDASNLASLTKILDLTDSTEARMYLEISTVLDSLSEDIEQTKRAFNSLNDSDLVKFGSNAQHATYHPVDRKKLASFSPESLVKILDPKQKNRFLLALSQSPQGAWYLFGGSYFEGSSGYRKFNELIENYLVDTAVPISKRAEFFRSGFVNLVPPPNTLYLPPDHEKIMGTIFKSGVLEELSEDEISKFYNAVKRGPGLPWMTSMLLKDSLSHPNKRFLGKIILEDKSASDYMGYKDTQLASLRAAFDKPLKTESQIRLPASIGAGCGPHFEAVGRVK